MWNITIFLKILFIITLLFCGVFSSPALSQEFLSGKILEINRDKMEIVIGVEEIEEGKTVYRKKVVVIADKNIFSEINDGKTVLSESPVIGEQIKIWGKWKDKKSGVLLASTIKKCRSGCSDPTGIISRLKKYLGKQKKNIRSKRYEKRKRRRNFKRGPGNGTRRP